MLPLPNMRPVPGQECDLQRPAAQLDDKRFNHNRRPSLFFLFFYNRCAGGIKVYFSLSLFGLVMATTNHISCAGPRADTIVLLATAALPDKEPPV